MTNSNAQLWDNGISAIGTWINSMKTNLGDQTPCTNHPEYNEYEGYRNSTYFYDCRVDWTSADGSAASLGVLLHP